MVRFEISTVDRYIKLYRDRLWNAFYVLIPATLIQKSESELIAFWTEIALST